jgi:chemotaxis protein MotB
MADELQGDGLEPLILKKKIKAPAGHHGGAWKVAYADFVTAMMAFFLLLWLLNATTEEQMTGLSDFFAPPGAAQEGVGIGQSLAGLTAAVDGALRSASSPPATRVPLPAYGAEESGEARGEEREDPNLVNTNEGERAAAQEEQELLDEAMSKLRQSIQEQSRVSDLQDSILFEITDEGLLIQLLDYQQREMFEPGTDQLTRRAIRLLALISSILVEMPNQLAITGHTDSLPQPGATATYGNWELSGDRAAASREWMARNGFPDERLVRVEGKADTELLDRRDPESERNRRISILLLREHPIERPATPPSAGSGRAPSEDAPSPSSGAAADPTGFAPPPLPSD